MKKIIYAAFAALLFAVSAATATADMVAQERIITEPGSPVQAPRSGIVDNYFISLQDAKGTCSTVIVSAKSPVEALTAAQVFCTDCLVMDVTDNFNKSPALARQTVRYCPIR